MDVKPWEIIKWAWQKPGWRKKNLAWWNAEKINIPDISERYGDWNVLCELANGQHVLIRALSEDRKAARAERSAYKAALDPWMAAGVDAMEGLSEELRVKGYCDGDPYFRPSRRAKEANR